ncbi:MAG: hypothetical protein WAW13_03400 [Minisyncoccia bacterium]
MIKQNKEIVVVWIDGVKYTYLPPQPAPKEERRVISMRRQIKAAVRFGNLNRLGKCY